MSRVSHKVRDGSQKHPLHEAVKEFINKDLHKDHVEIHAAARDLGKKTPALINKEIIDFAKRNGNYDKIRAMVVAFLDKEKLAKKNRVLSNVRPPAAGEVYERVVAKKIVDVGSGDGKRLVRYREHFATVEMVDLVEHQVVEGVPSEWKQVKEFHATEEIVTSFNSMTQLDDVTFARVQECDGVHVVPHVTKLIEDGYSKRVDGEWCETKIGEMKFRERDVGVGDFLKLGEYYRGVVTYKERKLDFSVKGECKADMRFRRDMVRMVRDVHEDHCTPKYDGTFVRLKSKDGKFVMSDRLGHGVWGIVEDRADMFLELEAVDDGYYLLRVLRFNGMRPPHSIGGLRRFVERCKPSVDGVNLKVPELMRVKDIPADPGENYDGVVFRVGEVDHVMNYGISLDLRPKTQQELTDFLINERAAKRVEHFGCGAHSIYSVCVRERDDGVFQCYWKERFDKNIEDKMSSWKGKFKLLTVDRFRLANETEDEVGMRFYMDPAEGESSDDDSDLDDE